MTNTNNTYNVNQMGYILAGIGYSTRHYIEEGGRSGCTIMSFIEHMKDKVLSGEPANKAIEVYSFLSKLVTYYAVCDGSVANKQGHIFITLDDQRVMIYDNVNMQMVACDFSELYDNLRECLTECHLSKYVEVIEEQMEKLEKEPNPDDFPHDFRFAMNNHNYDGILEIERSFVSVGEEETPFMAKMDVIILKSAVGIHGIQASVIALNSMKIKEYEPPVTEDNEDDCDCEDCSHSEREDGYGDILSEIFHLWNKCDLRDPYDNYTDFTRYVYHRVLDGEGNIEDYQNIYRFLKELQTYIYLPSLNRRMRKLVIIQNGGITLHDMATREDWYADLGVLGDIFDEYYSERSDCSWQLVEAVETTPLIKFEEHVDDGIEMCEYASTFDIVQVTDSRSIYHFDIIKQIEDWRDAKYNDELEESGSPEISVDEEAETSESDNEDWVE